MFTALIDDKRVIKKLSDEDTDLIINFWKVQLANIEVKDETDSDQLGIISKQFKERIINKAAALCNNNNNVDDKADTTTTTAAKYRYCSGELRRMYVRSSLEQEPEPIRMESKNRWGKMSWQENNIIITKRKRQFLPFGWYCSECDTFMSDKRRTGLYLEVYRLADPLVIGSGRTPDELQPERDDAFGKPHDDPLVKAIHPFGVYAGCGNDVKRHMNRILISLCDNDDEAIAIRAKMSKKELQDLTNTVDMIRKIRGW